MWANLSVEFERLPNGRLRCTVQPADEHGGVIEEMAAYSFECKDEDEAQRRVMRAFKQEGVALGTPKRVADA